MRKGRAKIGVWYWLLAWSNIWMVLYLIKIIAEKKIIVAKVFNYSAFIKESFLKAEFLVHSCLKYSPLGQKQQWGELLF